MKALQRLTWVELKLFTRDPLSLVFTLALPFFFLIVLNGVFGNEPEEIPEDDVWRGVGPADYYVPAYVGLVMAAIGVLSMPVRLASYRERGVLRRFRASAMPLWAVLGSQVAVALATAVVGAVSIAIASAVIYGTDFPHDWLPFIPAFVLAAFAFAALGVLLGSVLPTSRSAQGAGDHAVLRDVPALRLGPSAGRAQWGDEGRGERPPPHLRGDAAAGPVAWLRLGHRRLDRRRRDPRGLGPALVPLLPLGIALSSAGAPACG